MQNPKVSIITGTWNREAFLPAILACVQWQDYENIEWLVLDDSDEPSETLKNCPWDKLKYIYSKERVTLGQKRNLLIAQATGDIIVNFDDDDYYGPSYVRNRVEALVNSGHKLSIMSGFFAYQHNTGHFGYYKTHIKKGPAFQFHRNGVTLVNLENIKIPLIHMCFGWSFAYYKSLWETVKFQDITMFEDRQFSLQCVNEKHTGINFYESRSIDAIHGIHNLSSSNCFPQFLIPPFMLSLNSPLPMQHLKRLNGIVRDINAQKQQQQQAQALVPEPSGAA